jgi:hypothetical protein
MQSASAGHPTHPSIKNKRGAGVISPLHVLASNSANNYTLVPEESSNIAVSREAYILAGIALLV